MHIAIVRTEFIKARGGAERYAVGLARAWLEQGHRISIVCTKHDPADAAGMEVVTVSRPKILGPWKHRWFAARAGEAARETGAEATLCLARAFPGDVLRLGDGLHRAWLGARYPDLAQRKRAFLNPRHRQLLKLEGEMFLPGRFQLYVANSAMIRRAVTHMYGVDPSRILVIANGVDSSRFHPGVRARRNELRALRGIDPNAKLVLFAGMDFRRKGLIEAARGFVELARTSPDRDRLRFVCVGKGDTEDARRVIGEAGFTANARFLDPTPAMEDWYACADVFLLPTMHDPSANAVTEALACGLPVITSGENGARQHIVAGRNGVVLNNRMDAQKMGRALRMMLDQAQDPQAIARISRVMTTKDNAGLMLEALQKAKAMRGLKVTAPPYTQSGNRAAMLRALKRRMWAEGDTRDYREVFKAMLKQEQ